MVWDASESVATVFTGKKSPPAALLLLNTISLENIISNLKMKGTEDY